MKVVVPYKHEGANLAPIHLALGRPTDWVPAYRDTIDGRRVVWARFPDGLSTDVIYLRDHTGQHRVRPWKSLP